MIPIIDLLIFLLCLLIVAAHNVASELNLFFLRLLVFLESCVVLASSCKDLETKIVNIYLYFLAEKSTVNNPVMIVLNALSNDFSEKNPKLAATNINIHIVLNLTASKQVCNQE